MSNGTSGQGPTDPFTKAWTDLFAKMTTPAGQAQSPQQPAWPDETVKQMQRTMFEAMAKQADEYLRSPQFLTMMKQMMDQSIAFKQQIDRFITEAYRGVQAPAQAAKRSHTAARCGEGAKVVIGGLGRSKGRAGSYYFTKATGPGGTARICDCPKFAPSR